MSKSKRAELLQKWALRLEAIAHDLAAEGLFESAKNIREAASAVDNVARKLRADYYERV